MPALGRRITEDIMLAFRDLAALYDDILEWSVSSDLPASVLTVELVVDSADVTVGERRAIEALGMIVGSAQFTVTRRAAELVA